MTIWLLIASLAFRPALAGSWSAISHPAGEAWQWSVDTDVVVAIANGNPTREEGSVWTRGVYIFNGTRILATWLDYYEFYEDDRWIPLFLVVPAPGGAASDTSTDSLVLDLIGSSEHGCGDLGLDVVEMTITPSLVSSSSAIDFSVDVSGVPYMSLPPTGTITVEHSDGETPIDAEDQAFGEDSDEFTSLDSPDPRVVSEIGRGGATFFPNMSIVSNDPPWTQVQGHWYSDGGSPAVEDGFIELDWDHGCEESYGMTSLELLVTTRLPYGPWP